ncbi:glycoside hydrolase family 88/105 protein [Butyrivibrio sp. VCD2006]|uniref:glycoside hydrolase family 88/105 protein n=1 Tax=Butyrivibrio sp. VCD2006 TaxID=1280664 RepID=UPI00040E53DE|nr:glycoside hydrolase family 88 protein [Butyrivibrio sp. VCD2006]
MTKEETRKLLTEYVQYLMDNSDAERPMWNIEKVRSGKENKWNYIDGCMITALLRLHELTGEKKYLDFADSFVSYYVNEDGTIKTYDVFEYNLDNVRPACNLFALYDLTGKEKYRKAMDTVRSQLETMPRTKEGNFWHKKIYPNQVWLDGLYMAQPFYMEYEKRYCKRNGCLDSFKQFENVKRLMRDGETGLYYHGYDESREMYWADKTTGCSPNFWLRATGWYMAALVDTAEAMGEETYYEYRTLQNTLKELADSILKYMDSDSKMFYQVINKGKEEGNYLETSGSALVAYALLKGVRLKFLPERFAKVAEDIFYGITDKYLSKNEEGLPRLGGICLVAGLGGAQHRDGSLEYYFGEPVVENDAKGTAPLLMAYTELLGLEKKGVLSGI